MRETNYPNLFLSSRHSSARHTCNFITTVPGIAERTRYLEGLTWASSSGSSSEQDGGGEAEQDGEGESGGVALVMAAIQAASSAKRFARSVSVSLFSDSRKSRMACTSSSRHR